VNFQDAHRIFKTARNKASGKPLGNNTRLHQRKNWDGDAYYYAVTLHGTDVVEIYRDGKRVLNSGGWQTITTKDRINTYGAGRVIQKDFVWYWHPESEWDDLKLVRFEDGMTVTPLRALTHA